MIKRNQGFDGRVFLTQPEWETYCRRKPVRYIKKKKDSVCVLCGETGNDNNPLQNAHRIGFDIGIIELALTPDFLDSDDNIVSAHRNICNKSVELTVTESIEYLSSLGYILPRFLMN